MTELDVVRDDAVQKQRISFKGGEPLSFDASLSADIYLQSCTMARAATKALQRYQSMIATKRAWEFMKLYHLSEILAF